MNLATSAVLFVNMINFGTGNTYEIGRYEGVHPVPVGSIASPTPGTCHLWSPSVVHVNDRYELYVAESDCEGWHAIRRYVSRDGVRFSRGEAVITEPDRQLRMPFLVHDGTTYHLWYTVDGPAGFSTELVYATSADGVGFESHGTQHASPDGRSIAVTTGFRLGVNWLLLIEEYTEDLTRSSAHVVLTTSPADGPYRRVADMAIGQTAPKISPSLVCQADSGRWQGIFTEYGATGDRFAHEWTALYHAKSLEGPWVRDPIAPALPLWNGEAKTSVENPTPADTDASLLRCESLGL